MKFESPQPWSERLCLCVTGGSAFKLNFFSRESIDGDWVSVDNAQSGFDVMDWWESLQKHLIDTGSPEFGCGTARLDSSGNLEVVLLDEESDPLADTNPLDIVVAVAERGTKFAQFDSSLDEVISDPAVERDPSEATETATRSGSPKFSKDECFQCIWDCMTESLPDNWKTAQMKIEVDGKSSDVSYTYTAGLFPKKVSFRTSNVFAPINAAIAIRQIMIEEGNEWSTAVIELRRNGNMQINPIG